jgi:hypothetical protein
MPRLIRAQLRRRAVDLVEALQGEGTICVAGCAPSPARYAISYWRGATGQVMGVGHLSADIDAMQAAERGESARLVLADGRSIDVSITRRGAGTDWGEIEIRNRGMEKEVPGAAVFSLNHERRRRQQQGT